MKKGNTDPSIASITDNEGADEEEEEEEEEGGLSSKCFTADDDDESFESDDEASEMEESDDNISYSASDTSKNPVTSVPVILSVHKNYEAYTKCQVLRRIHARRLQGMVVSPLDRDFRPTIHHKLIDSCPVNDDNLTNARITFDPDFPRFRGKTTQQRPIRVDEV